jgi:hypothetical protein
MLGSGELGVVALGLCLSLGCGGSDESTNMPPGTGGTGAGGSAATGNETSTQLVDEVLSATGKLCEQIAKCYPDLQTPGAPSCNAPASGGRKIQYQNPGIDPSLESLLSKCFGEYPDQDELAQWVHCSADVGRTNAECFSSCPADGEACVNAGNAAIALCDTSAIQAQLKACYNPK